MSTEDLLLSLPYPIAVIGNGRCDEFGEEIDSFPSVIRMNNFVQEGYEKDVGSKLSAWCVNCWWDVTKRELGSVPVFTVFHEQDDNNRPLRWMMDRGMSVILPDRRWSEEVRTLKRKHPSCGLMLLFALHMLEIEYEAFGFDGMQSGHYWDPNHAHTHPEESREVGILLEGLAPIR